MRVHSRLIRSLGVVAVTAAMAVFAAAPAYAAPPSNDTFAGAQPIGILPFATTLDTTEATTDATDQEANAQCGAPALDASVWFSITAAADGYLLADVNASSYSAGVLVVTGAPGSFSLVTCGPGAVAFPVTAGTTYYLLVIDDQLDGGGNGGLLSLTVQEVPPPPQVDVTVDATAGFDPHTGSATVSGTISCIGEVAVTFVEVTLQQRVGRGVVSGSGGMPVHCDGTVRPWSVAITPALGSKFAGGKAASVTFAVSCGPVFCGIDYEERIVKLSRR